MPQPDVRRRRLRMSIAAGLLFAAGPVSGLTPALAAVEPPGAARTVAPPAPRRLRAVLAAPTAAVLSWARTPGASRYNLLKPPGVLVWSGAATTARRPGLVPGSRYTWSVQAVGPTGAASPASSPVSLTVPPAVPGGLAAAVTADGVTLHWRPAAGARSYLVEPLAADGVPSGPMRSTGATSLRLTGLTPGAVARWAVAAAAADRTRSPFSKPVHFTAPAAVPAGLSAVLTTAPTPADPSATVEVGWQPAAGAVSYRVADYRGRPVFAGAGTTVSLAGLAPGTRYAFTVASVDRAGLAGRASAPATVVVPRLPDPVPTLRTLVWGGLTRSFYVAVPPSTATSIVAPVGRAMPAIVLLHGHSDTARHFLATTRILAPALAAGEVVIAPDSPDGAWNDGRLDPQPGGHPPGPPGRDDVGFVLAAVASLVQQGIVDPARVTVAGFSNGAGLAMRIAAQDPGRVAELVSFAGALISDGRAVLPHSPVPTVLVHGDADTTQPWTGRAEIDPALPAQMSQPATRRIWQLADAATGVAVTASITAPAWAPSLAPTTVTRWSGAAPLAFYRVSGGAHEWPYLPCALGVSTGCSPDVRTGSQAESFDGTALLVSIAATARLGFDAG